ncbi:MAG TPA: DUF3047 domain-containing protein [Nitrospiria bacterium]|jgi:hypothetical protein
MSSLKGLAFGLLVILFFLDPSFADRPNVLKVGEFSKAVEGENIPEGWEPLTFKKILTHTRYEVIKEGDVTVIQAMSDGGASGLTRKIHIDLKEYPVIQWRWKVDNVIQSSDVFSKEADDYAARIYITFEYDPDKVSFGKKVKYKAGRLIFGDIPIAAINYIWESKTPKGTIVDNAYTDFVKMIVVESGEERVGGWVEEERNVFDDYKKAFNEEPPLINGVAIMTDTDNTGESAQGFYGDIIFKKGPGS